MICFSMRKSILGLAACFFVLCASHSAKAQNIGIGNLQLSLDNAWVANGYGNATGSTIAVGTQLTGYVTVNGVTGNGGTTYVNCWALNQSTGQGSEIYSTATPVSLYAQFPWTPSTSGTYQVYCSADYQGNYANGTVYTGNITLVVNP